MSGNTVRLGHRRIWIYFNVKIKEPLVIDGFSKGYISDAEQVSAPHIYCLLFIFWAMIL